MSPTPRNSSGTTLEKTAKDELVSQFSPSRRILAQSFSDNVLRPFQEILGPCLRESGSAIESTPSTLLTYQVVYWLMACVALTEGVMRTAVEQFWFQITPRFPDQAVEPVTDAALCTARKNLGVSLFKGVFDRFVALFRKKFGRDFRWKGFHLVGIDGTTLNLPANAKNLWKRFPGSSSQHGSGSHPQMLLVALVDLWTGLARRFLAVSKQHGENFCARWLVRYLGKEDLLLGDRNFPAYDLFCWIRKTGAHFLFRVSEWRLSSSKYRRHHLGRKDDYLMVLTVPPAVAKLHPSLPDCLTVRVLEFRLKNGNLLRIVTSLLDPKKYPYDEVVSLYAERWHHETAHREWKHSLELSNIRSHSEAGVLQEIFLQLTLNNVLRWIQADACEEESFKPVDLQFLETKRLAQTAARRAEYLEDHELPYLYKQLVHQVARKQIRKRPGRNYPRSSTEIVKRRRSLEPPTPGQRVMASGVMGSAPI